MSDQAAGEAVAGEVRAWTDDDIYAAMEPHTFEIRMGERIKVVTVRESAEGLLMTMRDDMASTIATLEQEVARLQGLVAATSRRRGGGVMGKTQTWKPVESYENARIALQYGESAPLPDNMAVCELVDTDDADPVAGVPVDDVLRDIIQRWRNTMAVRATEFLQKNERDPNGIVGWAEVTIIDEWLDKPAEGAQ